MAAISDCHAARLEFQDTSVLIDADYLPRPQSGLFACSPVQISPYARRGNVSPAKIGSMPHRDTAVSRDVLDRFAERLVRLPGWRSARAGAGRCVDLIAMALVAAG